MNNYPPPLLHSADVSAGQQKLAWVRSRMPVLRSIEKQWKKDQPLKDHRIGICLHLEAKTAYLALVLNRAGARVAISGSNPLSTQDDVANALAEEGVHVYSWYGASPSDYDAFLDAVLDSRPQLLIDDGGDLVSRLHTQRPRQAEQTLGGAEETTTGIVRLRAMDDKGALRFPMLAVNDAASKSLFDNRYGTGQSVWDGVMRTTNLLIAGKEVVVVGYGWCGKGVARRAQGLGARVTVCEIDPVRANEALMDGFQVRPLTEAAALGDIFVTVTGCRDAIRAEHFQAMKDGAVLANAGHFDVEISKPDLERLAEQIEPARPNIRTYHLSGGRRLHLLAEGRLVNLAAGDGHPLGVMDMTFSLQALSMRYLARQHDRLTAGLHPVPVEVDRRVASLRLEALGVQIDRLTADQEAYLNEWRLD